MSRYSTQIPDSWKQSPKASFLRRISSLISSRLRKSNLSIANESINPLFNMTSREAQSIFDYARRGNYARLQYLYNEIEAKDPTLLTCVSRRASAISELGWKVVRSDQRLERNAEKSLVDEQIECVETAVAKIENFPDAVERLALAPFRGFAHISPVHLIDGTVRRFDLVDNWNMCWDRVRQCWLWNENASGFFDPSEDNPELKKIPSSELVSLVGDRAIDWPCLFIYLRMALGEGDWGRFMETYGIPPVILTMPELANKEDEEAFVEAAKSVYEGANGVVPYGTQVSYASESRGTNPFTEYLDHQQKLIVLMATGGTLTSLAESGAGTLAGNAQMDVWMQIVRRDVRRIGNAVNKQFCEDVIRREFKGKPILAEFKFDTEPPKDPKEVLEMASTASGAGFEMDADELSQVCGFTIRKKTEPTGGMGFNAKKPPVPEVPAVTAVASDGTEVAANREAAVECPIASIEPQKPPYNAAEAKPSPPSVAQETRTPQKPVFARNTKAEELAAALQEDFKPIADRIQAILALPEEQRATEAAKLLTEIDSLVPDDLAMAEVIGEQMKEAFGKQTNTGD